MNNPVDRYNESPMLRFVDSYVLDAIGALDEGTHRQLEALAPELDGLLGVMSSSWQEATEIAMGLTPEIEARIREMWASYASEAKLAGGEPDYVGFAQSIADQLCA